MNNKIFMFFGVCFVSLLLTGCAAPKKFLYEGKKMDQETSSLIGLRGERFGAKDWFDTFFLMIDKHSLSSALVGEPNEVDVIPGIHTGMVVCRGYNKVGYVPVVFEVVAGNSYEFSCFDLENQKVKVDIKDKGVKKSL